jgi:rubrerythrin
MDIIKFAIKMELEGEEYYREQAANNHENSLYPVFISLANDEGNHAKILKDKSKGLPCQVNATIKSPAQNVFDGIGNFRWT